MTEPCKHTCVLPVDDGNEYAGDAGGPNPTQYRCTGCGRLETPEALRERAPWIFGD